MYNDRKKVVIVGCGMVGMSYAYSMVNQNTCDELVLIDIDKKRAFGEAQDLAQGLPFAPSSMEIKSGDYNECENADLVCICAGCAQKEGESRRDLLKRNYDIFKTIVSSVIETGFNGVFLVASNPVDVMTQIVYQLSGFPAGRVVGSGTSLDSARLRHSLSDYFKINPRNVHAYVLGEHGDSEFVCWSNATLSVNPISQLVEKEKGLAKKIDEIANDVRGSAYSIIEAKGATYYAIGMVLTRLTRAILYDENSVFSVSAYLKGEYGEKGIYIGVPSVVNADGVRQIVEMDMTKEEQELFHRSVVIIKEMLKEIDII